MENGIADDTQGLGFGEPVIMVANFDSILMPAVMINNQVSCNSCHGTLREADSAANTSTSSTSLPKVADNSGGNFHTGKLVVALAISFGICAT
jgi:hypothetical protein